MARPPTTSLAALIAAAALAACGDERAPAPLTRLVFPPETRALAVIGPAGGQPALFSVDAGGAVRAVTRVGEALRPGNPMFVGGQMLEWVRNPIAGRLLPLSAGGFVVLFTGADDPRNPDAARYAKIAAHVARDGSVTVLPGWMEPGGPAAYQTDGAGRLYHADLATDASYRIHPPAVSPVLVDGGAARLDWPISAAADRVTSFALDDQGNLAYRAERRTDGGGTLKVAVLRPTAGPIVTWPEDGTLGSSWRGAEGALYVTRTAAGEPSTTELLRIDFGLETVATPVAAWTGAPGLLAGEPFALGDLRAFVRPADVVLLPPGGAAPEVHPHALGEVDAVASAGALWLVTEARSGGGRGLVRWRPRTPRPEAVTLLDGTAYDVERVAPYGDDGALAGVIRRSDGARLLLRVTLDPSGVGAAEPVDAGLGSPELRDALLLP